MLKSILVLYCLISTMSFDVFAMGTEKSLLPACPDKPNCVISLGGNTASQIEPFHYQGEPNLAIQRLIAVINEQPGAEITKQQGQYLYATFTSSVFRFVDDVMFLLDDSAKLIHVRSASRSGYSDFGVNRRRVETLREAFKRK